MPATIESPLDGSPTPYPPKKTLILKIISSDRGRYPVYNELMSYHWTLPLNNGRSSSIGTVYQLKGMPGGFHYDGPEPNEDVTVSGYQPKESDAGEVPANKFLGFERIVADEFISKQEYGWDCQSWRASVLEKHKGAGFVHDCITPGSVKAWLKEKET